jgi:hypothetical protein
MMIYHSSLIIIPESGMKDGSVGCVRAHRRSGEFDSLWKGKPAAWFADASVDGALNQLRQVVERSMMIRVDLRRGQCIVMRAILAAALGSHANGQAVAVAEVDGQVLDSSGAAFPGAQVKITQNQTKF